MCTTGCSRPQFQRRRSCRCLHLPSYTCTGSITSPMIVYRVFLDNKFELSLLLTLFRGSFHICHHCKMCIPRGNIVHSCRSCPPCSRWLGRCNISRWCPLWAGPACEMVLVVLLQYVFLHVSLKQLYFTKRKHLLITAGQVIKHGLVSRSMQMAVFILTLPYKF